MNRAHWCGPTYMPSRSNWFMAREVVPLESDIPSTSDPDHSLWVRQALARMESEEREILMLREYEQLSCARGCSARAWH